MSIDPQRLHTQIRAVSTTAPREYACPSCQRRTRDATGQCVSCRRAAMPRLERLTLPQLAALQSGIRSEMERRRAEIDAALGVSP